MEQFTNFDAADDELMTRNSFSVGNAAVFIGIVAAALYLLKRVCFEFGTPFFSFSVFFSPLFFGFVPSCAVIDFFFSFFFLFPIFFIFQFYGRRSTPSDKKPKPGVEEAPAPLLSDADKQEVRKRRLQYMIQNPPSAVPVNTEEATKRLTPEEAKRKAPPQDTAKKIVTTETPARESLVEVKKLKRDIPPPKEIQKTSPKPEEKTLKPEDETTKLEKKVTPAAGPVVYDPKLALSRTLGKIFGVTLSSEPRLFQLNELSAEKKQQLKSEDQQKPIYLEEDDIDSVLMERLKSLSEIEIMSYLLQTYFKITEEQRKVTMEEKREEFQE
jgi:hypothetical protein